MDLKKLDEYRLIDKAFDCGIVDDQEIIRILCDIAKLSETSAILTLSSYYDNKKEIKDYLKKNSVTSDKGPKQFGE